MQRHSATSAKKTGAKPKKRGPGQPEKEIDLKQLESLCQLQCTDSEIAAFFGVSRKTVQRHKEKPAFHEAMQSGRNKGMISLRRAQFQQALNGNTALLIFLGKNLLGQRDRPIEDEHETVDVVKYEWVEPQSEADQSQALTVVIHEEEEFQTGRIVQ